MNGSDASALADLQMNWDGAYAIAFDGFTWSARFYGTTETLKARSSSDLRQQIRDDYAGRKLAMRAIGSTSPASGADPADTVPANTEPVSTEPVDTEPVSTEPVDPEPVSTEPADTEPVSTEPADTEPVSTEPAGPGLKTAERPHTVPPSSWPGGLRFFSADDQAIA